jgi:hypothetical protein
MNLKAGLMSSSALMMLRFTEQHYRRAASIVGVKLDVVGGSRSAILRSLPGVFSGRWARSQMAKAVDDLGALRAELTPQASSMYLS